MIHEFRDLWCCDAYFLIWGGYMWELETAYSLWFCAKVKTLDGVHGMLFAAGNSSNEPTFFQDFLYSTVQTAFVSLFLSVKSYCGVGCRTGGEKENGETLSGSCCSLVYLKTGSHHINYICSWWEHVLIVRRYVRWNHDAPSGTLSRESHYSTNLVPRMWSDDVLWFHFDVFSTEGQTRDHQLRTPTCPLNAYSKGWMLLKPYHCDFDPLEF